MMKFVLVAALTTMLAACGGGESARHAPIVVEVAPQAVACTGITKQRCLQVRFKESEPWQLLYSDIKGFDYKPGFTYKLKVQQQAADQENPNHSRLAWELVKVVQRTEVKSGANKAETKQDTTQSAG